VPSKAELQLADAVIALKLKGTPLQEIADNLGLPSTKAVRKYLITGLARRAWESVADRDTLRAEHTARLETLMNAAWEKAVNPDDPEQLSAIKTCRELDDRIIKLHGLDAPTEIAVYSPAAAELEGWVQGMQAGRTSKYAALEATVIDVPALEAGPPVKVEIEDG
jgi:hypothetical protein